MLKKTSTLIIALVIVILFFTISFLIGISGQGQRTSEEIIFVIEPGQGVKQISNNLVEQELIKKSFYFNLYVWFKDWGTKLQAGEYILDKNLSIKKIAYKLAGGDAQSDEVEIKIIEGWDIKDIAEYFDKNNIIDSKKFVSLSGSGSDSCFFVESCKTDLLTTVPKGASLEGYLFPDTYRIFEDATTEEIIAKMLKNFESKITDQMLADIKKQNKTLHEIIIMASIIEKEVPIPADMKMISDIFYKRLEIGMPLQSDATINYFTHKGTTRPSLNDLQVVHPYNTYKNRGLTPGPISNPGISAIEASIYPQSNNYFYFLTTPKGKVIYTKTYENHLREKYKYYK